MAAWRRTLLVVALGAVVLPAPAGAARRPVAKRPAATTPAAVVKRCAPAGPTLQRRVGETTATLRWRASRAALPKRDAPRRAAPKRRATAKRAVAVSSAKRRGRSRRATVRRTSYRIRRGRAVVGQTTKTAMRVRVELDRSYGFSVTRLDARGKATPCAAKLRVRIDYRLPGAPSGLAVSGGEGGQRLTWTAARPGDSPIAGYRLLRDGATLGQTGATSWDLPGAPDSRHRFAVVAVDRAGRASRPSETVEAVAGRELPTTPGAVSAVTVSDTSVGVTWQRSSVRSGAIQGYRVLRDGEVVRQVSEPQVVLENLAPSTAYRIAVVAVDALGRTSGAATVDARTYDPVATSGTAHAYLLASTMQSFEDLRAHYRQIGVVHPTYYDCTGNASFEGADDPLVTRWAQARGIVVLPRVNCQRTATVSRILRDPATRAAWLDRMVAVAREVGYDGISLDFEAGPAADRAHMTSFVAELAQRLHADGRRLAIALSAKTRDSLTHPRSGIFDYPALAPHADHLFVMAWGLHWTTSVPGPQDDIRWVRQIADYVKALPERHKFVFGTNLYALDWPNGGGPANTATAHEYDDLVPRLPALGAQPLLDPVTDNWQARYVDAAGAPHEVWFPDAETTARRIRIARDAGLGAVGFWRLGREDQRIWDDPLLAPGAPW